jgi:hypothetical protein
MNGILALKLSMLTITCCKNVLHKLCSKEHLIVNHLLLGSVIPVVGFYGIPSPSPSPSPSLAHYSDLITPSGMTADDAPAMAYFIGICYFG